jgi:hypothetical protein
VASRRLDLGLASMRGVAPVLLWFKLGPGKLHVAPAVLLVLIAKGRLLGFVLGVGGHRWVLFIGGGYDVIWKNSSTKFYLQITPSNEDFRLNTVKRDKPDLDTIPT